MASAAVNPVLDSLLRNNLTLPDFLHDLLLYKDHTHQQYIQATLRKATDILDVFLNHPESRSLVQQWVLTTVSSMLGSELLQLVKRKNGFHFKAVHAQASQIEQFSIPDMASQLQQLAPGLWGLLHGLMSLSSDPLGRERRVPLEFADEEGTARPEMGGGDVGMEEDSDAQYWSNHSDEEADENEAEDEEAEATRGRASKRKRQAAQRRKALLQIRTVACLSTCMLSVNQRCNLLPSINGFFCHASGTPETVINMMAHAGLSISTDSIHNAVDSLSEESRLKIREHGQSLCTAWAFDNIGWQQKPADPTLEHQATHIEATTAMFLPLRHGVTAEDLRCSQALWEASPINPQPTRTPFKPTFQHLVKLAREYQKPSSSQEGNTHNNLSRRLRINAWHIRHALVQYGEHFDQFRPNLGDPETVLQIPVEKTTQIAARAMHINEGSHDGMAAVINNLAKQAGIGHPDDKGFAAVQTRDMSEYVILNHWDLGSIEKYLGIQLSRVIEANPKRRLQFLIAVLGLFHLEMAAGESLLKTYISPPGSRTGEDSVYEHVGILRPQEAGHFVSGKGPGYRKTHRFIHLDAAACILDCWRVHVSRGTPGFPSLQAFADSNPTWEKIVDISETIAMENVAGRNFRASRRRQDGERDQVFENTQLKLRDFLQYVELHHAITHGDIGRVEATLVDWSMIFKATGKHKYSAFVIETLMNLNFVYPEPLRHAFRLHWLCNPQGKPNTFRAVDWCMELNNLYTKVIFAGSGPARTIEYIIKQSPLIDLYRACHGIIKDNYFILSRTRHHTPANVRRTFHRLLHHLALHNPHVFRAGRKAPYSFKDQVYEGSHLLQKQPNLVVEGLGDPDNETANQDLAVEDFEM